MDVEYLLNEGENTYSYVIVDSEDTDLSNKDDNDNEKVTWLEPCVKLLISLIEQYRPKVGKSLQLKTKKKMYTLISEIMLTKGYSFTPIQIENKWKSLERGYKNKICQNKKTGQNRSTCLFEKELNEVFATRSNIFPEFTLSTQQEKNQEDLQREAGVVDLETNSSASTKHQEDPQSSTSALTPAKKPKLNCTTNELKLLRQQREIFHTEKIRLQEKKLEAYEKRTSSIAEKNLLLKDLLKKL